MKTTPFGRACAATAAATIAGALAFGNFVLLLAGAFLLAALVLARPAGAVTVVRTVVPAAVRAGERVVVRREVTSAGPVVVHDALPDAFALETDASNVRVANGGVSESVYAGIAGRRGEHILPPTKAHVLDPLGSAEPAVVESGGEARIVVEATGGRIGRMRAPRAWGASQYAEGDAAVRGPKTNEFRELRGYAPGDPLKIVNWKASARASIGEELVLLVNEYEPEGKKAIWLFLDAGPGTAKGTSARDLLDILVEGTLAAADHYLSRGHRVGLATYGVKPMVVYPDHGREQYRRFVTILTHLRQPAAGEPVTGLSQAVEASHGFLVREKPMLLLFSSLNDPRDVEGMTRAQVLASSGRRPAPAILILATLAPSTGPDAVVDRLAEAKGRAAALDFQRRGARVLRWNPDETPLAALLAAGVR